jgi:hypothetical protein
MLTEELFSKVAPAKTRLAKRYHSGRGHKFAAAKVRNILNMAKEIHSFLPLTILILRFFNIFVHFLILPKRQKDRKEVKIRRQNSAMCVRGKICNP